MHTIMMNMTSVMTMLVEHDYHHSIMIYDYDEQHYCYEYVISIVCSG